MAASRAAIAPYIAALGVDAIWLSPFFASPMKDFGYDVSDYCAVDPMFGTLDDFRALIAESHRLGLRCSRNYPAAAPAPSPRLMRQPC